MSVDPGNVQYCQVVWGIGEVVADTDADPDDNPDWLAMPGVEVELTPEIDRITVNGTGGHKTILVRSIPAKTDADGILRLMKGTPKAISTAPVYIVASNSPNIIPEEFKWSARVIIPGGLPFTINFFAPAGGVVNLANVIEVPPSPTADLTAWATVVMQAEAARDDVIRAKADINEIAPYIIVDASLVGRDIVFKQANDGERVAANVVPDVQVGTVTDVAPGTSASVALRKVDDVVFFDFSLQAGAAGGMPYNQTIAANTHLDTLSQPGQYLGRSVSVTTTANGYPVAASGNLNVYNLTASAIIQEYTPYQTTSAGRTVFRRIYISGAWQPWRAFTAQRIESPSGNPGVAAYTYNEVNNNEVQVGLINLALGNANLDDIVIAGGYQQFVSANATLVNNYPTAAGNGFLEVFNAGSGASVIQRYTVQGGNAHGAKGVYIRRRNGSVWEAWQYIAPQAIDKSAGLAMRTWDQVAGRDQVTYYDSGRRDITTLVTSAAAGDALVQGNVRLSRYGAMVEIAFEAIRGAVAGEYRFSLPNGYRPGTVRVAPLFAQGGDLSVRGKIEIGWDGQTCKVFGVLADANLNGHVVFRTTDILPTTLPGANSSSPSNN